MNYEEIRKAVDEGKGVWRVSPNSEIDQIVVEHHGGYFVQHRRTLAPIEDYKHTEFVVKNDEALLD